MAKASRKNKGIKHSIRIEKFLCSIGWGKAKILPLKADFSSRKFARIRRKNLNPKKAVLMCANKDQKNEEFVNIAGLLCNLGLSAPKIYDFDKKNGFVLMEDLGDSNFGAMLDLGTDPLPLYKKAVEFLAFLHRNFENKKAIAANLNLPLFNAKVFAKQAELFLDFYFLKMKGRQARKTERREFHQAWLEVLKPLDFLPQTLMLRDFMPDNLMNLPRRKEIRSVGVLDFQDAGIGPLPYDLASLCECVRRDVPVSLLEKMVKYYCSLNPVLAKKDLLYYCRVFSLQRHMRILGIVSRLAETQGAEDKLAYIPRVLGYIKLLINDEAVKPVKKWLLKNNFLNE